jgi:hypothetical protein
MAASGYILNVPPARGDTLLCAAREADGGAWAKAAEPVPRFLHSKRFPLVVFASFESQSVTHIANGRKGSSAGTGLVRLNLEDLQPLKSPIPYAVLLEAIPARLRQHLRRVFENGGIIPPKTLGAMVDAITKLDDTIAPRLSRFSDQRRERIRALTRQSRENLAVQKETLGMALEIAGLPKEELLAWSPTANQRSFLDGLPQAYVREDAMIVADLSTVPGFSAIQDGVTHFAARTFEAQHNPGVRLTVTMANKLALEEQTGADLIYYNETYRSFVMVQYKAMERGNDGPEFRWKAGDQLAQEIQRMDDLLGELAKIPPDDDPDGFRFTHDPFMLKFCSRMDFDPDDKGLFPGIYLPVGLWKKLSVSGRLRGPKGGNLLTYDNVGRRINNTEFATLVANAWIGTTIGQSHLLEKVIRAVLTTGKTVTFAIKRKPKDPSVRQVTDYNPFIGSHAEDIDLSQVIQIGDDNA